MRTLALTATVLALAWAAPAPAQMCPGQTTGSTASASGQPGGMGCPMMRSAAMGSDQSAQGQRRPMCPMMAMMGGGMMGGMMGGGMGGMQQQPQQPTQPSAPETPQTPRPQ